MQTRVKKKLLSKKLNQKRVKIKFPDKRNKRLSRKSFSYTKKGKSCVMKQTSLQKGWDSAV